MTTDRTPADRCACARLDRRRLLVAAGAAGLAATLPAAAFAQSATPEASPAAAGPGVAIKSMTRDEFNAEMVQDLGLTEGTPGGTFVGALTSDIQTVMPFLAEEAASISVASLIFDSLTGGDPRTGQPAPNGLADWWEVAPDGVTYTFHLNPNATWHDGQPVTADDVQFSFDALADPATGSVYTASFLDTAASWKALDDHTFQVVAKEPKMDFLYNLTAYIVPKHVWESVDRKDWKGDPGATGLDPARVVGSGPFKFKEWKAGESISLVRNDAYYDKVPYLDEYVIKIWPDQTAVVNALLNDEVDATGLEPADVQGVDGQEGIKIEVFPTRNFTYLEYNLDPTVTTKWQDDRVRKALFYALDRESIVNNILLGYSEVAQGTQPVISYAYAPDKIETHYTHDPEKAKQLLADAGWTDSDGDGVVDRDGEAMAFEYLYPSGSPTSDQMAAYIQDAWAKIGVKATPKALEFPALIEATTTNPTYDIAAYGFQWDATFIQDAMFGCDQYQVGFNDMKYCNPELDKINAEAKRTFDEAKRADLLIQASNIVNEDLPVMVLHFSKGIDAHNERLQNYVVTTWDTPLSYVWVQE